MLKLHSPDPKFQGKSLIPQDAIKAHCHQCNGGAPDTCVCLDCPLHGHSVVPDLSGAKRDQLQAIEARCLDCAVSVMRVRDCTAFKPIDGQAACTLWPYREGQLNVLSESGKEPELNAMDQLNEPDIDVAAAQKTLLDFCD